MPFFALLALFSCSMFKLKAKGQETAPPQSPPSPLRARIHEDPDQLQDELQDPEEAFHLRPPDEAENHPRDRIHPADAVEDESEKGQQFQHRPLD
jgi:hypothetical protein